MLLDPVDSAGSSKPPVVVDDEQPRRELDQGMRPTISVPIAVVAVLAAADAGPAGDSFPLMDLLGTPVLDSPTARKDPPLPPLQHATESGILLPITLSPPGSDC